MHDTALAIGKLAIEIYGAGAATRILDVGSADVNGTLRQFAGPDFDYVGLDLESGPGVDVVIKPQASFPFEDESFDLVVATSVLEHDPAFWQTFLEMCRVARDGGFVYVNAPSNGLIHRYPEDHWRFYPDCGRALSRWAKSQGMAIELVESFTASRRDDIWNDFAAVFRKGASSSTQRTRNLHSEIDCDNIIVGDEGEILNPRCETEDMRLLSAEIGKNAELSLEREQFIKSAEETRNHLNTAQLKIHSIEEINAQIESSRAELADKLATSEKWNFKLSSARSELERENALLAKKIAKFTKEMENMQSRLREADKEKEMSVNLLLETERARLKLEQEYAALESRVVEQDRALSEKDAQLEDLRDRFELIERRLHERNREVGALSLRLAREDEKAASAVNEAEWLAKVAYTVLEVRPKWWSFQGHRGRLTLLERRLNRLGLFDSDAYLARHPDVRSSGTSALIHYLRHGRLERRPLS